MRRWCHVRAAPFEQLVSCIPEGDAVELVAERTDEVVRIFGGAAAAVQVAANVGPVSAGQ